jgi:hypothetical protein
MKKAVLFAFLGVAVAANLWWGVRERIPPLETAVPGWLVVRRLDLGVERKADVTAALDGWQGYEIFLPRNYRHAMVRLEVEIEGQTRQLGGVIHKAADGPLRVNLRFRKPDVEIVPEVRELYGVTGEPRRDVYLMEIVTGSTPGGAGRQAVVLAPRTDGATLNGFSMVTPPDVRAFSPTEQFNLIEMRLLASRGSAPAFLPNDAVVLRCRVQEMYWSESKNRPVFPSP